MFRPCRYLSKLVASRLLPLLALGGFLAGTIGVPLPRLVTLKSGSQPFPCQGHRCGCQTADACWQGCCCSTNEEKLAWAAEHDVIPPDFVFAAAEQERAIASAHSSSCCAVEAARSGDQSTTESQPELYEAPRITIDFVLAIEARRCQGQAQLWLALGAVTPPPPALLLDLSSPVCGDALVAASSLASVSLSPATPPPKA